MLPIALLRWFTLSSVLLWYAIYWQGGRKAIEDIQKSVKAGKSRLDTLVMVALLLLSGWVTLNGLTVCLGKQSVMLLQHGAIVWGGSLLTAMGILGMFYCRHYLGRFWTAETTLRPDHQVVDEGPYGVVRHPIYTFAILLYSGLGLVFPLPANLLAIVLILVAYAIKAWEEDTFLEQELTGYGTYRQHVRYRLFPGLW
jgi:protein-S-isoprenylcysteine O-methyltransferase Ste14